MRPGRPGRSTSPSFVTPRRPSLVRLKSMNPLSAGAVFAGRKGAGPEVKRLSSESWNATGKSTRKSSRTPPRSRYRPRSGARWPLTASSTQMAGGATMGWWIGGTKSISAWIMVSMNSPVVIALSIALNHSDHMLNEGLQNSMMFHEKLFIYTW